LTSFRGTVTPDTEELPGSAFAFDLDDAEPVRKTVRPLASQRGDEQPNGQSWM
jgi:hypothetical protein